MTSSKNSLRTAERISSLLDGYAKPEIKEIAALIDDDKKDLVNAAYNVLHRDIGDDKMLRTETRLKKALKNHQPEK